MPDRLDSEAAILAACFIRPSVLGDLAGQVEEADFLHPAHKGLWTAMSALWLEGLPMEPSIIATRLESPQARQALGSLGGVDYITLLPNQCVVFETVGYHVKAIKASARRYRWGQMLARLGMRSTNAAETDEAFCEAVGAEVLRMMLVEGDKASDMSHEKDRKTVLKEVIAALEYAHKHKGEKMLGVPTGIDVFDEHAKGLRAGQMVVLAARPGVGKTALMIQIIDTAAAAGMPVLVFSLEMTALELGKRSVSAESGVDAQRMSTGDLTPAHWVKITQAASRLSENNVTVVDIGSCDLLEMRAKAKRWRMNNPAPHALIAIDYLQLLKSTSKDANREQQVAEVSIAIKQMAKDLGVPVLALAQLNRKVEDRTNKRPGLSDLRESGQIEQDADVVMFLHREEMFSKKPEDKGKAELIVAKARSMPTFTAELMWQAHLTKFCNPAPGYRS